MKATVSREWLESVLNDRIRDPDPDGYRFIDDPVKRILDDLIQMKLLALDGDDNAAGEASEQTC